MKNVKLKDQPPGSAREISRVLIGAEGKIMANGDSFLLRFMNAVHDVLDTPVTFVREKLVVPNQQQYPYYHQKFRRVPTIDECYTDDEVCIFEANAQYQRDKLVDDQILGILRKRYEQCVWDHGEDRDHFCMDIYKEYTNASDAWFMKYGEMGVHMNVKSAYMKQKHRMIWERRHGPVGTGMKNQI